MSRPRLQGVERVVFLLGALFVLGLQAWLLARLPAAGQPAPPATPQDTPQQGVPPMIGVPDGSNILWLTADDRGLSPPRSEVKAATSFDVFVRNQAKRPHDFRLRQQGGQVVRAFSAVPAGQQQGASVSLPPGMYSIDGDGLEQTAIIESK